MEPSLLLYCRAKGETMNDDVRKRRARKLESERRLVEAIDSVLADGGDQSPFVAVAAFEATLTQENGGTAGSPPYERVKLAPRHYGGGKTRQGG